MVSSEELHDVKVIINAQQHIISVINKKVSKLDASLKNVNNQKSELKELEEILKELEDNSSVLSSSDVEDWDENEIIKILNKTANKNFAKINTLNYKNWKQFVNESLIYCTSNNIDSTLPYESFLNEKNLQQLKSESYINQYKWDNWDYIFVGTAGVLASLTDYFLVKIPRTINYSGTLQEGSPITEFLKNQINSENSGTWFSDFAKRMEKSCKVPYDTVNNGLDGMTGRTHRLQSLGHDPVLGFIFGIIDIYRGTLTGFSYDALSKTHTLKVKTISEKQSINLIESFLLQIGHLISDVGTKMGIQPPFFTLFQDINFTSPFSQKNRTIGEIARWMYLNGFDLRHFITQGITPTTIELILRTYIMIKHYQENGNVKFDLASNPKYRSMLLSSHAIASAGNIGKIILMQGNPLAINYAEWLALFRYLLPSLKYWVFTKQGIEFEHLKSINENSWNDIIKSSDDILNKVYVKQIEPINLGKYEW